MTELFEIMTELSEMTELFGMTKKILIFYLSKYLSMNTFYFSKF